MNFEWFTPSASMEEARRRMLRPEGEPKVPYRLTNDDKEFLRDNKIRPDDGE